MPTPAINDPAHGGAAVPAAAGNSRPRTAIARRRKGAALVIVLMMMLLVTSVTVVFLARSSTSAKSAARQSGGFQAKAIADLAIARVAAELGEEAAEGAKKPVPPVLPAGIGNYNTDPRSTKLVRWSSHSQAPAGLPATISNPASTISTTSKPLDGPAFAKSRWNAPRLMNANATFDAFTAPDWIYVSENGTTGNGTGTVPAGTKIAGRYAYMLYDVGGMFDINVAGFSDNPDDLGDKGGTACADLKDLFQADGGNFQSFLAWRNGSDIPSLEDLYGNSTIAGPTGAGLLENPQKGVPQGQNRLFSRSELISAADGGNVLGLTPSLAANLRTHSAIPNRISAGDLFADGGSTPVKINDNKLRATKDAGFTAYRLGGNATTYTVKTGKPLFQNRFPLARLRWLADRESDGTPKHQEQIKQHFGLTWDSGARLFIYTSPDGSSPVSEIKTLVDLATRINGSGPVREPDFFEWLKAAINPDSLGQSGGSTNRMFDGHPVGTKDVPWERSKDLHILRIGLNAIDQADPDSIPTGARSAFSGVTPEPFDSFGQENLPGINEVVVSGIRRNDLMEAYLQFELWNPNRQAFGTKPPKGYDGEPISGYRVQATEGRALIEPCVYVQEGRAYERITTNNGWAQLREVREKSWEVLTKGSFTAPELAGRAMTLSLNFSGGTGDFFKEPALANDAVNPLGADRTTSATVGSGVPVFLGANPFDESNGILIGTVAAPELVISGLSYAEIYPDLITVPDPVGQREATLKDGTILKESANDRFFQPGNSKSFNAFRIFSDYTILWDVETSPITLQTEVGSGGNWFPTNRFHRIALDMHTSDGQGRQTYIYCDQDTHVENRWASKASNVSGSCFSNWSEAITRKGYPMTDPRTERFGLTDQLHATPSTGIMPASSSVWGTGNALGTWNLPHGLTASVGKYDFGASTLSNTGPAPGWRIQATGAPNVSVPAALARNYSGDPIATHYYEDTPGGVARPADARWTPADGHPALPVDANPNALKARPIILDRPFRNVGELGVVFRDVPWKSLDLFSPDSADRRLLDVFSIEDGEEVHGKISLNSASSDTIKAVITEAASDPSALLAGSMPDIKAGELADTLGSSTFRGSEEWLDFLANSATSKADGGYSRYKHEAESFARALSSSTDTRHWQLMADVVAQSGKLAGAANSLNSFVVDGQRRYWVYFVIDRVTGELVSQSWNPVYE
jgi:hypothetical protein